MKRASHRAGIEFIALNDELECLDPCEVDGYISTILLADLFGKDPMDVAEAVVRYRRKHAGEPTETWC